MARKTEEWEDEELDEEEEETEDEEEETLQDLFKDNIRSLIKERAKYASTSEEYMVLTQRIGEETENLRNAEEADNEQAQKVCAIRNKNTALWQTLGTVAGNIAGSTIGAFINRSNVKTVVGYEQDGGIVNSKALKFVK